LALTIGDIDWKRILRDEERLGFWLVCGGWTDGPRMGDVIGDMSEVVLTGGWILRDQGTGLKNLPRDQEARMRLVSIKSISRRRELMIYPPTGVSLFFAVLFGIFTYPVLGVQIDDKDVTFAIEVELLNDESVPAGLIGVKIQEDIEHELWWDKGLRFIDAEKSKEAVIVKTIWVVEDDESQRLLCHDELTESGYAVMLAANGKEALKQLDAAKPDLVILDIVMPVMDGMETLGKIIREYRDVPIILNTAFSSYQDDFMSWAADAYIVKSADLRELKAKVQEILSGSRPLI
jgi:two-component system response regulator (stage 0 sporulation protein F)